MKTEKQISDAVAQNALMCGGKSSPVPTHSAMSNTDFDPDANATDAEDDDDEDGED
jgi:hypothetical protein